MMTMREQIRAVVQLHVAFGDGSPRMNEVFDTLAVHAVALHDAPELTRQILMERLLFSQDQVDGFQNAASMAIRVAQRIDHPLLSVITRIDESWPTQSQCPPAREMMPWLFVLGDTSLLGMQTVGFGGSRRATDRSLKVTRTLVAELIANDVVIVSGGAHGVDALAHRAALEHGGKTVVVLAQGIGTFPVPSHWWDYIERGQLVVVSEFSPMAGWEGAQALQRNGTVIRLSGAFVVIQAEEMSGTWSAGRNALRMKRPLFVVQQSGEGAEYFAGNEQLIAGGGFQLMVPADGSMPVDVAQTLLGNDRRLEESTDQLRLF